MFKSYNTYPSTRRSIHIIRQHLVRFSAALVLCVGVCAPINSALAQVDMNRLQLVAVTGTKAIFKIGRKRYVLHVGESTPDGVRLINTQPGGAQFSNGVREELIPLNLSGVHQSGQPEDPSLVLMADNQGSFFVTGAVNNERVRFLVDTGASVIAMSSTTAAEIGIDLTDAREGIAQTASGTARMRQVNLSRVEIGDITLYNIEAGILDGDFPKTPLLGMSFLKQVTMHREGRKMVLSQ